MSSKKLACPQTDCSLFDYQLFVISRCTSQKFVLNVIHVSCVKGRGFHALIDSRNFPVMLMML